MSGAHRTSPRGIARRRATLAAGALIATTALAVAPAAQAAPATTVNSQQVAENSYSAWESLIKIGDNLGRTQSAVVNPAAGLAPTGWLPTSTSTYGSSTSKQDFLAALGTAASMVITPADTSRVPGLPALTSAGTLPAQLLLGEPLLGAAAEGGVANLKILGAVGALNLINVETLGQNVAADLLGGGLNLGRTTEVRQDAGNLTGIPSIGQALAFFPDADLTSSRWSNSVAWPALLVNGDTWITQDRLTVGGVTSDELKEKFAAGLNNPDPLIVERGSVKTWWSTCGWFPCFHQKWVPALDGDGNPVREVTYDPSTRIPGALGVLDGIDFTGFSVIKRAAGGDYRMPGDGRIGWLGQATQVIIPGRGGAAATVATVPLFAGGIAVPFDMLTAGGSYTPGIITQTGQSVNSTLGSRSLGLSLPRLGAGLQSTSFLESAHLGPDGLSYNSGWTVALLNGGPVPIPLVYSLGSYNVGPGGFGFTSPSLFGVGLPGFQIGAAPSSGGGSGLTGAIAGFEPPTTLIPLDPKLLFSALNITDPTGLGLTDPFGTAQSVLSPLYTELVTPVATPLWQAGADVTGQAVNTVSEQGAALTGQALETTDRIAGITEAVSGTVEPVIPEFPASGLDGTTIEPAVTGAAQALDESQRAAENVGDASTNGFGPTTSSTGEASGTGTSTGNPDGTSTGAASGTGNSDSTSTSTGTGGASGTGGGEASGNGTGSGGASDSEESSSTAGATESEPSFTPAAPPGDNFGGDGSGGGTGDSAAPAAGEGGGGGGGTE